MIMNDNLPDYYDGMYKDGFEPWQILEAFRRTMRKQIEDDQPDNYTITLKTNVRLK